MRERAVRLPRDPFSLSLSPSLSGTYGVTVRIERGGSISGVGRGAVRVPEAEARWPIHVTGTLGTLATSDTSCLPRLSNWPG